MTWQDAINGAFELAGSVFILRSIMQLHRDKQVHGVHWWTPAFFGVWGLWNLYYYPHLG